MATFLNKKEQVIDFKLTSYGRHLLGKGSFKPTFYAFLDDNIIYDSQYFGRVEVQNEARKRIKEETQYLEGITLFRDLEEINGRDGVGEINFFPIDIEPTQEIPRKDMFRFDQLLGDAYLQGGAQVAPAWKAVSLTNKFLSSSFMDAQNNSRVPQLHLTASYTLRSMPADFFYQKSFNSVDPRKFELSTVEFVDNSIIYLERKDPLFYFEEMNTELLIKNFDIEVFEYDEKVATEEFQHLKRKYFDKVEPQIVNGLMTAPFDRSDSPSVATEDKYSMDYQSTLTPQNVKYFFDIIKDEHIDRESACKLAEEFNKDSYYIDLDFDCDNLHSDDDLFFDIYGATEEAEICQD